MNRRQCLLALSHSLHLWIAASLLVSLFLSSASVAHATTISVTIFNDNFTNDGNCSLREAVEAANTDTAVDGCPAGAGADTIDLPVGTYSLSLTTGLIVTGGTVTIQSSGGTATIDASGLGDRVLQVQAAATVTLQGLTLTGGSVSGDGGGILTAGTLTLNSVTLTGNSAAGLSLGGGLSNFSGATTINTSTISGNSADQGGGIAVIGGTVSVARSLISGNAATALGGGAYAGSGATLNLTNTTLRSGSAVDGAGVYSDGTITIIHSTLSQNVASGSGGGIRNNVSVQLRNSMVAGNSAAVSGPDCFGTVSAPSNNFISTTANCTPFGGGTIFTGASPLGAFNGQVYPLVVPSAAIDAATPADCVSPDQIGNPRPLDGDGNGAAVCDLGSFESPTVIPTATPTPTVTQTLPPGVTPSNTPTATATTAPPPATATPIPGNTSPPQPTPVGIQPVGKGGGTFRCGNWRVIIPANVVPDGGGLHCGDFNPDVAPSAPAGFRLLRHTINVNVYDNNGSWITQFATPLTFCYPYATADLTVAGNNTSRFVVQTAPVGGAWRTVTTEVNATAREACAKVTHLTLFDLSAKVDAAAPGTYMVQPGDNLFRIALRFGVTVAALQAANGLSGIFIYVGQVLIIPGQGGSAPPPANPGPGGTYLVQPGDNLFRIALRFGTTISALQAANGLGSSILIYAGQTLIIPGKGPTPTRGALPTPRPGSSTTYVVQPGETLFRIALRFGVTVSALQAANNLTGTLIFAGQRLVIPGIAPTATRTPTPSGSRMPTATAPTTARRTYIVVTGDTLFRLALRFGTTVAKLQAANNLSGTRIYVGQVLVIP